MAFPSSTITNGAQAQALLVNAAAAKGIAQPTGGLSMADFVAWVVGELMTAPPAGVVPPAAKFSTINVTVGTLAAGNITGASYVSLTSTNAVPGTQTTRTATQMFADVTNALAGDAYVLRITNSGAGVFTLAAGTGVTLTGTMTVAQNTTRDFVVTFTSSSALVIQCVGVGTFG